MSTLDIQPLDQARRKEQLLRPPRPEEKIFRMCKFRGCTPITADQKTRPTGEVINHPIQENGKIPKTIYGFQDYWWS
jgi:hypothetical protein